MWPARAAVVGARHNSGFLADRHGRATFSAPADNCAMRALYRERPLVALLVNYPICCCRDRGPAAPGSLCLHRGQGWMKSRLKLTDIADGDYRVFALEAIEVGIFRAGSKVLAYENVCPHAGGPVCQGKIFNQVEEVITPDKRAPGCASASSAISSARGTATNSISPPAAIRATRRCDSRRCRSRSATARFSSASPTESPRAPTHPTALSSRP